MTNRNLTPAASSAKDPLLQTNQKTTTVRSFYAHAHCVFRSDVRLDVRFSLGRTFKRTFYLDKYVSIFDTDGLPYAPTKNTVRMRIKGSYCVFFFWFVCSNGSFAEEAAGVKFRFVITQLLEGIHMLMISGQHFVL